MPKSKPHFKQSGTKKRPKKPADSSELAHQPATAASDMAAQSSSTGHDHAKSHSLGTAPEASSVRLPAIKNRRQVRIRRILPFLALFVLLAGAGYWSLVYRNQDTGREHQDLINAVSRLVVVPENEVPAVTTVVDESQVNQEFLRSAKKGDRVLLYFQAGKAIVFRPSTQQIVNIGPLETPKPRVFLRNGTNKDVLDAAAEKVRNSSDFQLASRDDSPKKNYQKTTVVDVTGTRPDIARRLAGYLNAAVGPLPEGESRPDGDMLVIIGDDYAR